MTKEEYLKMYKEDKLAELCERLEEDRDELSKQLSELSGCVREANKRCEELDIWGNTEKLFAKLKSLPAEDFMRLYFKMMKLVEDPHEVERVITSKPELRGVIGANSRSTWC